MRDDCPSELDHLCGLCECHVCCNIDHFDSFGNAEDEYGDEVEDEDEDEIEYDVNNDDNVGDDYEYDDDDDNDTDGDEINIL